MVSVRLRHALLAALCLLSSLAHADDYRINAAEVAIADSDVTVSATLPAMQRADGIYLVVADESYRPSSLSEGRLTFPRGMLCSTGLGFAIFFDDYATTLLLGKTMRPITDRLRISREKLAYLVDSTAAPTGNEALQ